VLRHADASSGGHDARHGRDIERIDTRPAGPDDVDRILKSVHSRRIRAHRSCESGDLIGSFATRGEDGHERAELTGHGLAGHHRLHH
jgi:hypothetical protein